MLNVAVDPTKVPALAFERSPGYWQTVGRRLLRDKLAVGAGIFILGLLILAAGGALLAPADPYASSMLNRLKPIGFEGHPLGTDELGRDMLSRCLYGAQLSVIIGLSAAALATIISVVIGEGGSGGALAIGCANVNLIMENR